MNNNNVFFIGEIDLGNSKDKISIVCCPENPISGEIIAIQYFKYIDTIKRDNNDIVITDHYTYNCLESENKAFSCFREENQSTISSKPEINESIFVMLYNLLRSKDFSFKSAQIGVSNNKKHISDADAKKIIFPLFEEITLKQENDLDSMLSNICSDLQSKRL